MLGNPTDIQKSLKLAEEEKNILKTQLEENKIDDNSPLVHRIMETYERFCNKTLTFEEGVVAMKQDEKKKKKMIPSNYPLSPRAKSPVFSPMVLKSTSYYSSPRDDFNIHATINSTMNNFNKFNEKPSVTTTPKMNDPPLSCRNLTKTPEEKIRNVMSGSQSTRNSTKKKITFPGDPKEDEIVDKEKKSKITASKSIGPKIRFKDV